MAALWKRAILAAVTAALLASSTSAQTVLLPLFRRSEPPEKLPPPERNDKPRNDAKNEKNDKPKNDKPKDDTPSTPGLVPVPEAAPGIGLPELLRLALEQNPRLTQARYAVDAATGRAIQAGLYPNPNVAVIFDELFDRQGRAGIITAPQITQEIVTANKLHLNRAAADREVDQAMLSVLALRYARFAAIRQAYYDLLTLRRRIDILESLVKLAEQSVATSEKLLKSGEAARLDLVQLQVEREKFRAEMESANQELPAAFRRLAAAVGVISLPLQPIFGALNEALPEYDLDQSREIIRRAHPEILAAKKGVDRAQLLLERARVEPIPNVTVQVGYTRQNQNKSNDALIGFSVPVPCWNKNEGNIAAAQAQVGEAVQQVGRLETELIDRLAETHRIYAAARRRAELYAKAVLPRAKESYEISLKGYQGGQFDYLRVLEAQRAYSQADLEYVRSLGEAWRAAAELSGLLLQESWPH